MANAKTNNRMIARTMAATALHPKAAAITIRA